MPLTRDEQNLHDAVVHWLSKGMVEGALADRAGVSRATLRCFIRDSVPLTDVERNRITGALATHVLADEEPSNPPL